VPAALAAIPELFAGLGSTAAAAGTTAAADAGATAATAAATDTAATAATAAAADTATTAAATGAAAGGTAATTSSVASTASTLATAATAGSALYQLSQGGPKINVPPTPQNGAGQDQAVAQADAQAIKRAQAADGLQASTGTAGGQAGSVLSPVTTSKNSVLGG